MALPTLSGYQLDETLGQSALGITYAGRWGNIPVVVKVLELGSDLGPSDMKAAQTEFRRRTEAVSALYHPAIVALRNYGQAPPYLYAVSGFLAGGSLADPEGREMFKPPLDLEDVIRYAAQLADALSEAHKRGVAHGNLKPSNIFIGEATGIGPAQLLVGDFAMISEHVRLTVAPLGQPRVWRYLAPEAPGQAPTPAGDIFSLAAVCYEWLTSKPAFDNVVPGSRKPLVAPTEARPFLTQWSALDAIFARALAPTPEQRYATITEFSDALTHILHPPAAQPSASADEARVIIDANDTRPSRELPTIRPDGSTSPFGEAAPTPRPAQQIDPSAFLLDSPIGPKPATADLRRMELNESLSGLGNDESGRKKRRGRKAVSAEIPIPVVRGPTTREQDYLAPAAPRRLMRGRRQSGKQRAPQSAAPIPLPPEAMGLPLDVPVPRREALGQVGRWALLGVLAVGGTVVVAEGIVHLAGNLFGNHQPTQPLQPPQLLGAHATAIQTLTWSPDSSRLATGAKGDNTIRLWQKANPGTPASQIVTDAKSGINDLSWSRDSHYLLVSTGGTNAQIWNVGQQQIIQHIPYGTVKAQWHPALNIAALVVSSDAKAPLTNKNVLIWDIANAKLLTTLSGHAAAVTAQAWWPGSSDVLLTSGDASGNLIVWEGASGAALAAVAHPNAGTTQAINTLGWASSAQHFATDGQDGTMKVFDAHRPDKIADWATGSSSPVALAWQTALNLVAVALANGSVQLWNASNNRLLSVLPGTASNPTSIAWSGDARSLAVGTGNGQILLWDTSPIH